MRLAYLLMTLKNSERRMVLVVAFVDMEVHGIDSGVSEDFESITEGVHSRDQDNQAHHDIDLKNETGSTLGADSFSTEVLEFVCSAIQQRYVVSQNPLLSLILVCLIVCSH
jgi:hypothetical protein